MSCEESWTEIHADVLSVARTAADLVRSLYEPLGSDGELAIRSAIINTILEKRKFPASLMKEIEKHVREML